MFPKISLTRLGQKCYRTLLEFQATPCGVPTPGLKSSILKNSNIPVCCLQSFVFCFCFFLQVPSSLVATAAIAKKRHRPEFLRECENEPLERGCFRGNFKGFKQFAALAGLRGVDGRRRRGPVLDCGKELLHCTVGEAEAAIQEHEAVVIRRRWFLKLNSYIFTSVTSVTSVPNSGIC